jgi:3-hydroxyacyl-CoA dehydrogenase
MWTRSPAFTKRPQDVVGMHFFSPANVMKLLEVVRGEKTAKDVLATVMGCRPRRSRRPPWFRACAMASSATA